MANYDIGLLLMHLQGSKASQSKNGFFIEIMAVAVVRTGTKGKLTSKTCLYLYVLMIMVALLQCDTYLSTNSRIHAIVDQKKVCFVCKQ